LVRAAKDAKNGLISVYGSAEVCSGLKKINVVKSNSVSWAECNGDASDHWRFHEMVHSPGQFLMQFLGKALYVHVGTGVANSGGERWLHATVAKGSGVQACYETVMAHEHCAKDYFSYAARGDKNCGCNGAEGSEVRGDSNSDMYKIEAGDQAGECVDTDDGEMAGCDDQALNQFVEATSLGTFVDSWTHAETGDTHSIALVRGWPSANPLATAPTGWPHARCSRTCP